MRVARARLLVAGVELKCALFALLLAATVFTGPALAQSAPPAVSTGTATSPAQPLTTGFVPGNAATPQPLPDLASNYAFPEQRGFVRAEPVFIYPSLGVGLGFSDNVFATPNDATSSGYFMLFPRVRAEVKHAGDVYAFTYNGRWGHYFQASAADVNDHEFVATSSNQFTARADLNANAYYLIKQDEPGSVDRSVTGTPDRWHAIGAFATFGYGSRDGPGRFEFDAGGTDKRYENNRDVTAALDVASWDVAGRFLYRVAPKTHLLAELRYTDYDYHSSPLDSSEQRYMLGATWDATAATSGALKVGYLTKQFKVEGLENHSGLTAEASVRWRPRTYSTLDVVGLYAPSDSTGTGLYTIDKSIAATWQHYWKSYFLTRVAASYLKSDFIGVSRTDNDSRIGIGGFFDVRTWLRLGLEFSHENRNSTDPTAEYSRNVVMLTVGGTL